MNEEGLPHGRARRAHEEESLSDELRSLADDARALAKAEFAYHKSRATYAGKQALIAAALTGAALVFLFFAVEAVVFGAILALSPSLSPMGATAAVTGGLAGAAVLCVALALFRWKRMKAKIAEQDD